MPPRRSHRKSRRGCLACKKRRVKCDESGPPCANCRCRQTECEYSTSPAGSSHDGSSQSVPTPCTKSMQSTPQAGLEDSAAASRRTNELRLLHRWTTVAYKSAASEVANDWDTWQKTVVEVALSRDFLLHTIFALTAFEMAFSFPADASKHLGIALEYQGLAFHGFRDHLRSLTDNLSQGSRGLTVEERKQREVYVKSLIEYYHFDPSDLPEKDIETLGIELDGEDYDALLYASTMLSALALASATAAWPSPSAADMERESTVQQALAHHDLTKGAVAVVMSKPNCIATHDLFNKFPSFTELEKGPLEPDTELAIERLTALNEGRKQTGAFGKPTLAYSAVQKALLWLEHVFRTCQDMKIRAFCLSWLLIAGEEYVQAVKDGDRIAMLTLVGWGVLIQPLGERQWWTKDFGKSLIQEVSIAFRDDHDAQVQKVLGWAEGRVERDAMRDLCRDGTIEVCD